MVFENTVNPQKEAGLEAINIFVKNSEALFYLKRECFVSSSFGKQLLSSVTRKNLQMSIKVAQK